MNFDREFWSKRFNELGYPIKLEEYPLNFLRDMKILPPNVRPVNVHCLYKTDLIEVVIIELKDGLSKGKCVSIARLWKKNTLKNPVIILTDGRDSYLTIVPEDSSYNEVKVLYLSEQLYHTDMIALDSMKYNSDQVILFKKYNDTFLPYEKVRDEFFKGYKEQFLSLVKILHGHMEEKTSYEYAQRFLGRLMFLYFLQKKGWLGRDKKFINAIKDFKDLNRVFYDGLNNPDNKYGLPFLNGSMFDREEYLTGNLIQELDGEMTPFFFDAREFFNAYNFTVDESSPLEKDVSIDPYLLGTVFEDMLPENERGNKGTFYTPPAEISFIVRRAIANYLSLNGFDTSDRIVEQKGSDEKINTTFEDGINRYIEKLGKSKDFGELERFKEKLLNAVVVDLAVGSGGFLILYIDEVVGMVNDAEMAVVGEATPAKILKERVINNVYGFDIENEATEIARLRVWLSYVVDEDKPRPLPNLDLNIATVVDSLQSVSGGFTDADPSLKEKKSRYMHESNKKKKGELKHEIKDLIKEMYGIKDNKEYVEYNLVGKANIVLMNPPYVRQESIPKDNKEYYVKTYGLDKKSDIYTYFFIRATTLLAPKGVVSIISSDKWLETSYGIKLQEYLKKRLIAIYGQRERSFGADVNTVISVFTNEMLDNPVEFVYMESYSGAKIRSMISIERNELKEGKWFYLRAPKLFMEKIYPKLTHKLRDFAEIKRGFTTGANDFFYMKDISHLYEADYLDNPKKFGEWGVTAGNERELKEQGLIYIENEGGERFVLDATDIVPVVRSPREVKSYVLGNPETYAFYPSPNKSPGPFSLKYINESMKKEYIIQKGTRKGEVVRGVHLLQSVSNNSPNWYNLRRLDPTNLISNEIMGDRLFTIYSPSPILASDMFVLIYPKKAKLQVIHSFMNSTVFYMLKELLGKRLGGGSGPLKIQVVDYEQLPVLDLEKIDFAEFNFGLARDVKRYSEEVAMEDRKKLDEAIFNWMGITDIHLGEFYEEFIELVEDRLIKADRGLKSQEKNDDEDN